MNIEATHSDGDGNILLRSEAFGYLVLSKEEALTLMAELAMAVSDEYGKFSSYGYPGCKAGEDGVIRLTLPPH